MAVRGLTIGIGANTTEFTKELKAMDRSVKDTSKQVGLLSKSLEFEWDASRFAQAQKLAQEALAQTDVKVKAVRDRLAHLEQAGKVDTKEYTRLQTELVNTEAKAVLLRKELQKLNDLKIDQLTKKFEKVGDGITKAGHALAPFSAAAAGVLAGFAAIGVSTINSADLLKTFADRVNLTAEELQRWQYIAMQTDVSNEELQAGLVKAQGAFGSLAKGDIDAASKALQGLGISAEEASKGMGANFDELVNKLVNIQDPILQAAYANEIFGERMGAKLVPMLKAGGEGLAELAREFENFDTLTNEQIDSLAEFDNVMNKIKYSFKVIKEQLGLALLPLMQTLADLINTKIIPAVQKMTEWFQGLSDRQVRFIFGTLATVAALAPMLLIVGKLTTGIGGLIRVVGGLSKALALLAAHPIIAAIGIIIGLIAILYNRNEAVKASIDELFETLQNSVGSILAAIMPTLQTLISTLLPIINSQLDALAPILQAATSALNSILKAVMPLVQVLLAILLPIITKIMGFIGPLVTLWVNTLIPVIEFLGQIFEKVFSKMPDVLNKVLDVVEGFVNGAVKAINILIKGLNALGKVLGFTIGELETVSLKATIQTESLKEPKEETVVSTTEQAEKALQTSSAASPVTSIVNNDYSDKQIKIEVIVQNYAEELDVDSLVREINLKLAQEL